VKECVFGFVQLHPSNQIRKEITRGIIQTHIYIIRIHGEDEILLLFLLEKGGRMRRIPLICRSKTQIASTILFSKSLKKMEEREETAFPRRVERMS